MTCTVKKAAEFHDFECSIDGAEEGHTYLCKWHEGEDTPAFWRKGHGAIPLVFVPFGVVLNCMKVFGIDLVATATA